MSKQIEKQFDFQLYSRQLVCDGITSFRKLMCSKILIYGMRGLGVEIAKNIILKGPEKVTLFDPEIATIRDMNSNGFILLYNLIKLNLFIIYFKKLFFSFINKQIRNFKSNTLRRIKEINFFIKAIIKFINSSIKMNTISNHMKIIIFRITTTMKFIFT